MLESMINSRRTMLRKFWDATAAAIEAFPIFENMLNNRS
jgi:hypothetical protein